MFHRQDIDEHRQTKKDISLYDLEDTSDPTIISIEENFIEKLDKQYSRQALTNLFESDLLTETQRGRFALYILKGLSLRQIAEYEKTSHIAIHKSISSCIDKLKKYFQYRVNTPPLKRH